MGNYHDTARLKANSPQVGERCPVSGVTFEAGDEVVVCQQSGVAFSAKHWSEALSMWNGRCPYCDTELPPSTLASDARVKPSEPHGGRVNMPIWAMTAGGIGLLVCGIIIGVLLLGGIIGGNANSGSDSSSGNDQPPGDLAVQSSLQSSEIDKKPVATSTPTEITQVAIGPSTSTQTQTSTPTPTHTPTPRPTNTPKPTHTRRPTVTYTPSPTPQPACSITARGEFAGLWQRYYERLGCPLYQSPKTLPIAGEQPFQNGHMFYLSDRPPQILVVYDASGDWQILDANWGNNDPEYSCQVSVPPGLWQPRRGFGNVWCHQLGGPSSRIGWATDDERGFNDLDIVQDFERGIIFRDSDGLAKRRVYVLFKGNWTFVREQY